VQDDRDVSTQGHCVSGTIHLGDQGSQKARFGTSRQPTEFQSRSVRKTSYCRSFLSWGIVNVTYEYLSNQLAPRWYRWLPVKSRQTRAVIPTICTCCFNQLPVILHLPDFSNELQTIFIQKMRELWIDAALSGASGKTCVTSKFLWWKILWI